ncbi:hypothetical protein D3C77_376310 [compost metagenome]
MSFIFLSKSSIYILERRALIDVPCGMPLPVELVFINSRPRTFSLKVFISQSLNPAVLGLFFDILSAVYNRSLLTTEDLVRDLYILKWSLGNEFFWSSLHHIDLSISWSKLSKKPEISIAIAVQSLWAFIFSKAMLAKSILLFPRALKASTESCSCDLSRAFSYKSDNNSV